MPTTALAPEIDVAAWERALYAFLAEKERRSGSRRTPEGYSRILQHFLGSLGVPPHGNRTAIAELLIIQLAQSKQDLRLVAKSPYSHTYCRFHRTATC
jgi:hypothetical protein